MSTTEAKSIYCGSSNNLASARFHETENFVLTSLLTLNFFTLEKSPLDLNYTPVQHEVFRQHVKSELLIIVN